MAKTSYLRCPACKQTTEHIKANYSEWIRHHHKGAIKAIVGSVVQIAETVGEMIIIIPLSEILAKITGVRIWKCGKCLDVRKLRSGDRLNRVG